MMPHYKKKIPRFSALQQTHQSLFEMLRFFLQATLKSADGTSELFS